MRRVTIQYNGQPHDADQIDFEPEREPWVEIRCEDGTRIRAKLIVQKVFRIDGQYAVDGEPIYQITTGLQLVVDAPPNLRRQEAQRVE